MPWLQGRCATPPPASFGLTEPVPLGACAILVKEDFLDVPMRTQQFWLDSVYVAIAAPGTSESSVLLLHVRRLPARPPTLASPVATVIFASNGYRCRQLHWMRPRPPCLPYMR